VIKKSTGCKTLRAVFRFEEASITSRSIVLSLAKLTPPTDPDPKIIIIIGSGSSDFLSPPAFPCRRRLDESLLGEG